jgi:hypothetical protein
MKKISIAALFLLTACAGPTYVIEKGPCDGILNRDDQWVCGKDSVKKACHPVPEKPLNVCEKL